MAAPILFDRPLVRRRLARALAGGYVDILLRHALGELEDRLGAVLRRFPLALDVATPTPAAAETLLKSGRVDAVVRLAPIAEAAAPCPGVIGDPEALPFAPERFELAVSVLAFHSLNDLPGALIRIRQSLRPDGLFLACLFGGATLTELRHAFAEAEAEIDGGVSPRVAPFADLRDLGALLQRAGFALPVADVETLTLRYADPFGLLADLRGMGLANVLVERRRHPLRRATLMRMVERYGERFADADGRVRATFELIWLSGWAPHESQQKPLRPGSAQARLADALGTVEHGAGERAGR